MLRNLRIKFVVIIMVLVGAVLVSVLGGSYVSAWQTQHDMTNEALQHSVEGSMFNLPRITMGGEEEHQDMNKRKPNMLVLAVEIDSEGVILSTNDAPLLIDSQTLSNVIDMALKSDADDGWDESIHIAWRRAQRSSGAWRVAIADTSAMDMGLRSLLLKDLGIICVAMGALLLIAIGLSTWMLKPVQTAWDQQRQFVADASHELKTPLAVIIANTQILSNDTTLSDESMRWVQGTADESKHMKNLVEELLELARTDETSSGATGAMKQEQTDFSAMVENASLEFDAIAFERGTSIEENIQSGIGVTGDPEWLERLCKILIDNACKYSEKGRPVNVVLSMQGHKCNLSVTNFGNTIDPEDLPHVFDRFYRTDKARSRDSKTSGFGLGLAIAKGIAVSHGGNITATSDADNGTTFSVTLPAHSI